MGSSRPTDRSLGEATFLPQWMKGKLDSRFDYTDSTFSPPADDTFFYIRYPKYQDASTSSGNSNREGFRPISEVLNSGKPTETSITSGASSSKLLQSSQAGRQEYKDVKNVDFSKHPLSCQPFIPYAAEKVNEPRIIVANKPKVKHQTVDDEFRNDKTAECGRSIVHVANQIMSSKFGKSNSSDSSSTITSQQQADDAAAQRKVSRSLPATPLASPSGTPDSSPKSRRRAYGNRFFTGAFVPDGERQHKNGWLLGSILGQSRELINPKIEEEDELNIDQVPQRALSRKKSISSQNLTYLGKDEKQQPSSSSTAQQRGIHVHILQAKPSELREMNFWSPTSM